MPTSLSVCMYLAEYRKIHWHLYRATTFTSASAIYYFYKGKMLSCKKNFFFQNALDLVRSSTRVFQMSADIALFPGGFLFFYYYVILLFESWWTASCDNFWRGNDVKWSGNDSIRTEISIGGSPLSGRVMIFFLFQLASQLPTWPPQLGGRSDNKVGKKNSLLYSSWETRLRGQMGSLDKTHYPLTFCYE